MSEWQKPGVSEVWAAIDAYLHVAYTREDAPIPPAVQTRVQALRQAGDDAQALFATPAFEADGKGNPHGATKYSLRLGNPRYPHMKLVVERSPDGTRHLFRTDTHDRHIRPAPGSREEGAFRELMEFNQRIALAIEAAWEEKGLRTFKAFLREDLGRRKASSEG